ncbi:MAG: prepilin peptidase [Rhodobacteraceae bacterium]|nr:prepilin peptidase [Paracoccaceae bacterium]
MFVSFFIILIVVGCMLATGWKDLTSMTIPNWISLVLVAGFFITAPFAWQGWAVFGTPILVGLVCFFIGVTLFAFGQMGGGDAKLFAATSIWWVWADLGYYAIYTALAGGVLTILIILGRKYLPEKALKTEWLHHLFKDEKKIPYGIALAFGALVTLPTSDLYLYASGIA